MTPSFAIRGLFLMCVGAVGLACGGGSAANHPTPDGGAGVDGAAGADGHTSQDMTTGDDHQVLEDASGADGQAPADVIDSVDGQSPRDLASPDGQSPGDACLNVYSSPGCGANVPQPRCVSSTLACLQYACGCDGHVIMGCHDFLAPFAYASPLGVTLLGSTCDPNADAGRDSMTPD